MCGIHNPYGIRFDAEPFRAPGLEDSAVEEESSPPDLIAPEEGEVERMEGVSARGRER